MIIMKIAIQNEPHWHELRAKHIGGSEVAALFGRSPYVTPWQLHMTKAGKLDMPFDDTHTRAGKFFEQGIAAWAADKWGMAIQKVEEYYTDDSTPGMGATLDYADDSGVPVEIKFTHHAGDSWKYEGDLLTEIPEAYVFQCQHQMACYGGDYAWLVAFIKGEVRRMKVRRSEEIIGQIRKRIADFWKAVAEDRPPPIDYQEDGDALNHMLLVGGVKDVSLPEVEDLIEVFIEATAQAKEAKERADGFKAQITEAVLKAMHGQNEPWKKAVVSAGRMRVTFTSVDENPGKLVTPEMVGTHVGGKKGYLMMRTKEES
jgi:putative phage-type endonuclease